MELSCLEYVWLMD